MKNKLIIFFIFFIVLFLSFSNLSALISDGLEGIDFYLYYGTTADDVTIKWDNDDYNILTDTYEVTIYNFERDININLVTGLTNNIFSFKCPKTGHWIVKIRVKRLNENNIYEYSPWFISTDSNFATVNENSKGWWLFSWIASTGSIIMN